MAGPTIRESDAAADVASLDQASEICIRWGRLRLRAAPGPKIIDVRSRKGLGSPAGALGPFAHEFDGGFGVFWRRWSQAAVPNGYWYVGRVGMSDIDLFVIGGGPAGLAAAIAASRRGMRVVVADGNRPPIDKPCGEGLLPDSRLFAGRIGIHFPDSLGFEFRGIRFHGNRRTVEASFPYGRGIGVRRTALHGVLIETAERAGVELRWSSPVSAMGDVKARYIVGADGSSSRVRRWAGLDSFSSNTRRFAYRQHFSLEPWTDCMEIYWAEGCQIYVTPVSKHEVCVALISRAPELRIEEALRRLFPILYERLEGKTATSRERGAITATARLSAVVRGNVALIGDASGSVDAITGEGMCLSFRQAETLADAMAQGDLPAYNLAHPRLSFRPHMMAKTMLLLDRGHTIRKLAFGAMSAQPWIFRRLLAVHVG